MNCTSPQRREHNTKGTVTLQYYPCGNCIACRLNRQADWAHRILLELSTVNIHNTAFITLTYDDEHLPPGNTLDKEELKRFIKDVRNETRNTVPTRYYACGEYGDKYGRAHYHLLMWGNPTGVYREVTRKRWQKGLVTIDPVNPNYVRYVAGYVVKKLTGMLGEEEYGDRQPPFALMSRQPGIGSRAADKIAHRLAQYGVVAKGDTLKEFNINFEGKIRVDGKLVPVPRFIIERVKKILEIRNSERDRRMIGHLNWLERKRDMEEVLEREEVGREKEQMILSRMKMTQRLS